MAETLIAGRYRLDTLLGKGGMSEVWCATDVELDRRVALKLLAPKADVERFEREARAFAALARTATARTWSSNTSPAERSKTASARDRYRTRRRARS